MPAVDLGDLEQPEVVFGLVGAVGVALGYFAEILEEALKANGYTVDFIQLSKFLTGLNLKTPLPPEGSGEYERLNTLMLRGNELREAAGGGALALMVASHINAGRPKEQPRALSGRAHVIRQLKHPEEIEWLRRIYGSAFYLIGLYTPRKQREHHLRVVRGLKPEQIEDLINRDEGEAAQWGQQLRNTFHLADVFIEFSGDYKEITGLGNETRRFVDLVFGNGIVTPKYEEYGMYLADAAALRSGDLSRQVGASILTQSGEILALGMNDVPRSGGGLYWSTDADDARDFVKGYDYNELMKRRILSEVLEKVDPEWSSLNQVQKDERIDEHAIRLGSARIMNLTEFGRAVHAEMEAITAAARNGIALKGATLFTTTFPCHNCAKHIVAAGISRVVYIEPYPKSMAIDLHEDSIALDDEYDAPLKKHPKVRFEPFVGIAPRRYAALFSTVTPDGRRLRRKVKGGHVNKEPLGIRHKASPLSYIERESAGALAAQSIGKISAPGGE